MINFTLPSFYRQFQVNYFIYKYSFSFPEFFKQPIHFTEFSGNMPGAIWYNYQYFEHNMPMYNKIAEIQQKAMLPIRLNCANNFIEISDYDDCYMNVILDIFRNGVNKIEISNLELMEKIMEKYPEYADFIFSKSADLLIPFTPEIINSFIETDNFCLIGLPDRLNYNEEFLKNISKPSKIEITVNPTCNPNCPNYIDCLTADQKNQLNYSETNNILECNMDKNNQIITIEEIKNNYIPKGFNHFTFSPCDYTSEIEQAIFYIEYFIKDEYQVQTIKNFIQAQKNRFRDEMR